MNDTANLLATATCATCGNNFEYEPVIICGRDLAKSIYQECEACKAQAEADSIMREARERETRAHEALRATLPPDLLATDTDHPDFNRPLWSVASMWSPTKLENSIGIVGPAGRCKTRVMALLAKRMILNGSRIAWTSAVRLKDAASDRHSRDQNTAALAREHLSECLSAPWLFMDDLGKNEWTPAFESQLFQILDHRMNYRLPMAWTSNVHPEAFSQVISASNAWPIIGRLTDRCTLLDLS